MTNKEFKRTTESFIHACNIKIDELNEQIEAEEEKKEINEDKLDELSTDKDTLENALNAAEEIQFEKE